MMRVQKGRTPDARDEAEQRTALFRIETLEDLRKEQELSTTGGGE